MDSNISSIISKSSYRVRLNGSLLLVVPQGCVEQFLVSALSAGTDVSILACDNECYKLKL